MANAIGTFWAAANALILSKKAEIGIVSVESGEAGKTTVTTPPGIVSWLDLEEARFVHTGGAVSLSVKFVLFCVAAGKSTSHEAIDAAIEIALAAISELAGVTVGSSVLALNDPPMDLVDASANRAVVSLTFDVDVPL